MNENTCELRSLIPIDGIDLFQRDKLVRQDRTYLNDKQRWYCIWKTLFPQSEPPCSPFLKTEVGLGPAMVRDY
jgi:hypothetical protein